MDITTNVADRLNKLVSRYNRDLLAEAAFKGMAGILFSIFTFGFLFWIGWFVGLSAGKLLSLEAWHCGVILAGLVFVVAAWSSWNQVNPLVGLKPLSDLDLFLTELSLASPNLLYFSPRHALAGSAVLLLGGPNNLFQALGLWAYRMSANGSLIEDSAQLLENCATSFSIRKIRVPAAALLLRRLALIKVIPQGSSMAFTLTEKGMKLLGKAKARSVQRAEAQNEFESEQD